MRQWSIGAAELAALLAACDGSGVPAPGPTFTTTPSPTPSPTPVTVQSSFAAGFDGWQPACADYSPGQEAIIGFDSGHELLPPPLDASAGVFLASDNRSDDVFMYLWRPVTGLAPDTRYRVEVAVAIATDAPPGCVGIGGAPGESVFVKAGAAPREPATGLSGGRIVANFDHGNQSQDGDDAVVLGGLAQPVPGDDCGAPSYQHKQLATGGDGPLVTSDSAGRLWLVVGADSGYEGHTRIYWLEVAATLTPE